MLHTTLDTINLNDDSGYRLYQAIEQGNEAAVSDMLANPNCPNYQNIKNKADLESKKPLILALCSFNIFNQLLKKFDHEITYMEKADAFSFATDDNDHIEIARILLKSTPTIITRERNSIGQTFEIAAKRGYLELLNFLLEFEDLKALATYNENTAVVKAKKKFASTPEGTNEKKRYQAIIDRLMQVPFVELLDAAVNGGDRDRIWSLLEKEKDSFQIDKAVEVAVTLAIENDRHDFLNILIEAYKDKFDYHNALVLSVINNDPTSLNIILPKIITQLDNSTKHRLIMQAIENYDPAPDALNILLEEPSIAALAAHNNNATIRDALMRINGTEPGSDERIGYERIIANLREIPGVQDLLTEQLAEELTTVAIQATDLRDITNFAENSMQSMTTAEKSLLSKLHQHYGASLSNKSWNAIRSEILCHFKDAYEKNPAKDGYQRVWMLEDSTTKIPFTFMPADTIGFYPKGPDCIVCWFDVNGNLETKTIDMQSVLSIYEAFSKNHWLYQESQDTVLLNGILKDLNIPAHPHQDKVLPLAYSPDLSPSALIAYYRHTFHSAWRYFSDSNPWMSPQAEHVQTLPNGQKRAIISDNDKTLISLIWTALCDQSVHLEPGFTQEGNIAVFASGIKEIECGHNHDAHPRYKPVSNENSAEITREDDLRPRRPSCSYGVTKRLLQSEYGHPYINCPEARALDIEIMFNRIDAQLIQKSEINSEFNNLIDRVERLDTIILEKILQDISDILELDDYESNDKIMLDDDALNQKNNALTIPDEQIRNFIQRTHLWFGNDRIDERFLKKLRFRHGTSGFRSIQHNSYGEFISYCTDNPLVAFCESIQAAITVEIKKRNEVKPILNQYSGKRDRDDFDRENEPEDNRLDGKLRKKIKLS